MKKRIFHIIKQLIANTLATTALSILLLCIVALIKNATSMGIAVPFEILLVNFLAHIGCILFDKIDMKYRVFNYLIMLVFLLGILVGFCFLFNWFEANETWIVCVIGLIVFLIAFVVDLIKIKHDANEINSYLTELRNKHNEENEIK